MGEKGGLKCGEKRVVGLKVGKRGGKKGIWLGKRVIGREKGGSVKGGGLRVVKRGRVKGGLRVGERG